MSAKKNKPPFVVSPFLPTPEMLEAGENAMTCIPPQPKEEAQSIFCAMLAAWDKQCHDEDGHSIVFNSTSLVVPFTPTDEQIDAGLEQVGSVLEREEVIELYKAMALAADAHYVDDCAYGKTTVSN